MNSLFQQGLGEGGQRGGEEQPHRDSGDRGPGGRPRVPGDDQARGRRQGTEQRRAEQEASWQQELRRLGVERAERAAQLEHTLALARLELERAESLDALDDTTKLAVAGAPNAAVLATIRSIRARRSSSSAAPKKACRSDTASIGNNSLTIAAITGASGVSARTTAFCV